MQEVEIGRYESMGDVRQVFVGRAEAGTQVRQAVSGPSAVAAYGEDAHTTRILIAPKEAERLEGLLWSRGGIDGYLRSDERFLVDLMDLCDREGVAYSLWSEGPETGVVFRPAE